jgi:hypothetical protein
MLAELGAALERAAGLNAEATALAEAQPPSDGRTALVSALRENRAAMICAVAALSAAWDDGFAASRPAGAGQHPVPPPRPELRLVAGG